LAQFGTNLLKISPGETVLGDQAHLPTEAVAMVGRIPEVTSVTATAMTTAHVYRSEHVPPPETGSIAVLAARTDLLESVHAGLAHGTWLNSATATYPAVVLGSTAAQRLGIALPTPKVKVWLNRQWFTVIGVLNAIPLAPELDNAALIGWSAATSRLGFDGYPTTIYTRTRDDAVVAVQAILARTANPEHPNEVKVSRPSDALAARQATDKAFTGLLLGLGAVALLVGGVGVANTMVITVLERRGEIGLRRSLGATRGQIRTQFLVESLMLSALGGLAGVTLGMAVTMIYATTRNLTAVIPAWATLGGLAATLAIGALAGLYPAVRASRLPPTEALTAP